jgi:hypothetical protein
MKGYIKRLSQDIEKLDAKLQALMAFKEAPREPIDNKQYGMLCKQAGLMEQLEDLMKQRLSYEKIVHPDYFEDLPAEEVDDADDCDEETTEE